MVGAVIRALIYLCFIALAFYFCLWVLAAIGIALPFMVVNILKVIFVLIAVLVLYNLFAARITGFDWWGRGPNP